MNVAKNRMNDDEYSSFCLERYKPFFDYLIQKGIKYSIEDETIYVEEIQKEILVFNNIELPPNVRFYFSDEDENGQEFYHHEILLINYPQKVLPTNIMLMKGDDLAIEDSPELQEIPDNFVLYGSLIAEKSFIKKIGKNVYIRDKVNLCDSKLEEIGDNLVVGKFLNVSDNKNLKKLGKNIYVGGSLNISTTQIKTIDISVYVSEHIIMSNNDGLIIPDNFVANGNLVINGSSVEKMGENIVIKQNLVMLAAYLTKLPKKLTVHRDLEASYSRLETFPDDIIVHGRVDLEGTQIKKLPDNFHFKNDLIIRNTIKSLYVNIQLGKNTIIYGNLYAENSDLEELPEDLIVFGMVHIENTKVRRLPLSLKNSKKIIFNNLFIENIDEFYSTKLTNNLDPVIIDSYSIDEDNIDALLLNFNDLNIDNEIELKNTLLYNVNEPIHKKLLLEQFEEITEEEIQKFIYNKNSCVLFKDNFKEGKIKLSPELGIVQNNPMVAQFLKQQPDSLSLHIQEPLKGKILLINYCRSKRAFKFLQKNNYQFTYQEYQIIKGWDPIKNIYEMYLLNSTLSQINRR